MVWREQPPNHALEPTAADTRVTVTTAAKAKGNAVKSGTLDLTRRTAINRTPTAAFRPRGVWSRASAAIPPARPRAFPLGTPAIPNYAASRPVKTVTGLAPNPAGDATSKRVIH